MSLTVCFFLLEVHALLLTDILVLLSKAEDGTERLFLKMYHVEGINGVRDEISPVIRLKDLLFRDRADRGKLSNTHVQCNTAVITCIVL